MPLAALGVVALLAVVCAGTLGAGWLYVNASMNKDLRLSEVPSNVDGIKTAQLGYDAAFDEFVPAPVWPRSVGSLDRTAVPWGTGATPWNMLGWAPDGHVRGAYEVRVNPAGTDFTVHGWIDLDADGVPAHYTATKSINTVQVTPDHVR
jgi:hypothetical protein